MVDRSKAAALTHMRSKRAVGLAVVCAHATQLELGCAQALLARVQTRQLRKSAVCRTQRLDGVAVVVAHRQRRALGALLECRHERRPCVRWTTRCMDGPLG